MSSLKEDIFRNPCLYFFSFLALFAITLLIGLSSFYLYRLANPFITAAIANQNIITDANAQLIVDSTTSQVQPNNSHPPCTIQSSGSKSLAQHNHKKCSLEKKTNAETFLINNTGQNPTALQPQQASTPGVNSQSTVTAADTLAALSMIIAAVTLMLTLGTTWFVTRQKELEKLLVEHEKQKKESLKLIDLRLSAESEILERYSRITKSPSAAAAQAAFITPYLQLLRSSDPEIRQKAHRKLSPFFSLGVIGSYKHTAQYIEALKAYLLKYQLADKTNHFCDLFDKS